MINPKPLMIALGVALAFSASQAAAQTKTLYVGINGGTLERAYSQFVFPEFEKANNVKIVVVPGTSSEILAKAIATKDKPQMQLMFLDDGIMYRAIELGLCGKLQPSPELAQVDKLARFKDDMAVGTGMGMTGLAYNTKMFKEKGWAPPTSWMDLADPKYKDKVVFQSVSASTFGLHAFLMFNRILGGSETNVEPGFGKFRDSIGKNVIEFIPNSSKVSEMIQTGDAGIFPLTPTLVDTFKGQGLPVEYVQPKEGSVVLMYAACVIANSGEDALAQKLAAFILSAPSQSKMLAEANSIPANPTASASTPEAQAKLDAFKTYMKTAIVVDWNAINAKRADWNNRWNRMIER